MYRLLSTNYGKVQAKLSGEADRPIIVWVHGVMASLKYFDAITALLKSDYYVIAFDQLGNGGSDKPLNFDYTIENEASTLWEALDILNLKKRIHLIGHSMGGAVVTEMAVQQPSRVAKLIMLDTSTDAKHIKLNPVLDYLDKPILGPFIKFMMNHHKLRKKESAAFAPQFNTDRLSHPELVMEAIKDMSRFTMIKTKNMYKAYTDKIPIHLRLKNLNIPTLILFGDQDPIATQKGLRQDQQVYTKLPHVTFKLIKGSGHVPRLEKPAELRRMIMNFI